MALRQIREEAQRKKEQKVKLVSTIFMIVCALAVVGGILCFAMNVTQFEKIEIGIGAEGEQSADLLNTPFFAVAGGALTVIAGTAGFILNAKSMNITLAVVFGLLALAALIVHIVNRGVDVWCIAGGALTVVYIAAALWRGSVMPAKDKSEA